MKEGRPPDPAPRPLIYWGDLTVTGNGDLPLANPFVPSQGEAVSIGVVAKRGGLLGVG